MRDLKQNKKSIFYANLSENITDGWGNSAKEYGTPQEYRLPVSLEKGEITQSGFGDSLNYYRTMTTHDMNCPIVESSHIWIDTPPTEPYNYRVDRVSRSLNCIVYALKRVEVSS